jgi:hypothetical protein
MCSIFIHLGVVQFDEEGVVHGAVRAMHIQQEAGTISHEEPAIRLMIDDLHMCALTFELSGRRSRPLERMVMQSAIDEGTDGCNAMHS